MLSTITKKKKEMRDKLLIKVRHTSRPSDTRRVYAGLTGKMQVPIREAALLPIFKRKIENIYFTMHARLHLLAQEKGCTRKRLADQEHFRLFSFLICWG